jgi:hypothetical protein
MSYDVDSQIRHAAIEGFAKDSTRLEIAICGRQETGNFGMAAFN